MNMNLAIEQQIDLEVLPAEALNVLEILNKIENHTADLRKKLMSELRPKGNLVRLNLEKI
jgi:hypothetical protein